MKVSRPDLESQGPGIEVLASRDVGPFAGDLRAGDAALKHVGKPEALVKVAIAARAFRAEARPPQSMQQPPQ